MSELSIFALRLLKFVEESVSEALHDSSTRRALLVEADSAMRILKRTVEREDPTKHAQLALQGVFGDDFGKLVQEGTPNDLEKLREALRTTMAARLVF